MKKMIIFGVGLLLAAGAIFFAVGNKPLTQEEVLLLANIEAIAQNEGDGSRYPERSGDADYCTLYVYINFSTGATFSSTDGNASVSGEWTKTTKRGLEDDCPIENGSGCNPYSCQEVPY